MNRISLLQAQIQPNEVVLLSTANDISYFTLFEFLVPEEREAFLILTPQLAYLIVSAFSPTPNAPELTILRGCYPSMVAKHLKQLVSEQKVTHLLYQGNSLYVDELEEIKKNLSTIECSALPPGFVWKHRMFKDTIEVDYLKEAGRIVTDALAEIETFFTVGITELELTSRLATLFAEKGSQQLAFPTIVAFGSHSTLPHHQPDNTPLLENTAILIDCGAVVHGYRSDMTRTWWFGKAENDTFLEISQIVKQAYAQVVDQLRQQDHPPITAKMIDQLARKYISEAGYGENFIHTTGHGIGLDIHEPPSLSWSDETEILPGMVITIEPGIYLEDTFGYRYENTVLITPDGAVELTHDSPPTQ